MAQKVKRLSTMQETRVQALGWEDPLEKEMAIHSSIIAWKIPWTEEPGRLQPMGLQRVGHDWATSLLPMRDNLQKIILLILNSSILSLVYRKLIMAGKKGTFKQGNYGHLNKETIFKCWLVWPIQDVAIPRTKNNGKILAALGQSSQGDNSFWKQEKVTIWKK